MRSDWRNARLAELGRIVTGKTPPSAVEGCFGGSTPFVTPSDYDGSKYIRRTARTLTACGERAIRGVRLPSNAVMVTCIGSDMGKAALNAAEAFTNQQINSLIVESEDLPEYVYYNLSMRKSELRTRASGSAQPILNKSAFGATEIELPSPRAQAAIVEVLGGLDDRIDLLRQTNTTLEAIAQALFKSWFIDFDPVRAKAEGREPEGMDAATAALFPAELEESALGLIPKGWTPGCIGDLADVIDCLHSKKPELVGEGRPYLQLNNIRNDGLLDASQLAFVCDADYTKWTSRIEVREGDCVITNVGRVGAVAQIPSGLLAAMGRNMTAIRLRSSKPFPTVLIELLLSSTMRAEIERRTDVGTILNALNVRSIPGLRFVLAPDDVLRAAECLLRPLRASMESNLERAAHLARVRDTLLPRLISGKLRVPDARTAVEEAAA